MKKINLFLFIGALAFSQIDFAKNIPSNLQQLRQQVVREYIKNLGSADYKAMAGLFEKDAVVVTPQGYANAKEFYYTFFPTIKSSETKYRISFLASHENPNSVVARFRFKAQLKNGQTIDAESIDQYFFAPHSIKLSAVYMFENVNFPEDKNLN